MFIHRRLLAQEGEEPTSTTPKPQPTIPSATPAPSPEPSQGEADFPGKKHMAEEIVRLRKERDDFIAKQKAAAEEAERKRLEDEGKWKEIADSEKTKREQLEASHAAKEREWKLRAKLVGLPELMIDGAVAKCTQETNIEEYAAKVLEDNKSLLVGVGDPHRAIAQGGRGSGSGGVTDWKKVQADMRSRNPSLVDPAIRKYQEYVHEHGTKPPGWDQ
jgi:hypothetical protein